MEVNTYTPSYPLNILSKIPTDDPKKMVALNALAFSAGALISMAPFSIGLSIYAGIGYSLYLAGNELFTNEKANLSLEKTAQIGMAVFSLVAGTCAGGLLFNAWLTQSLFVSAVKNRSILSGVEGMKTLVITAGFIYPITDTICRAAWNAFISLGDYVVSKRTQPLLHLIKPLVSQYPWYSAIALSVGCGFAKKITKSDDNAVDQAQQLMSDMIEPADFEAFILNEVVPGNVPFGNANGNQQFIDYYNTTIKPKAEEAIAYFNRPKRDANAYTHAQNALFCKKVLEHYPIVDSENQARIKHDLGVVFEKLFLNLPYSPENDGDDALFFVRHLLLNKSDPLYQKLVECELDTYGNLKKAGFNYTTDGKEDLNRIMVAAKTDPIVQMQEKLFSFIEAPKKTEKKTNQVALETFFNYSLGFFALCAAMTNPLLTVFGASSAYVMNVNLKDKTKNPFNYEEDFLENIKQNFATGTTTNARLSAYALGLIFFTSPMIIGGKIGDMLYKQLNTSK